MKALLKAVARTVSASTSSASSIRYHLKVLSFRPQLSMAPKLVLHVVRILKETIAHSSAATHGTGNHQCCMELTDNP